MIELKQHDKIPSGSWTGPPLSDAELVAAFASGKANAGLVLGSPSNGLVDFDFDSEVAARIADSLLSELPAFGRPSSLRSHRFVLCDEARAADGQCKKVEFKLPHSMADHPRLQSAHGVMVLEVRANGCYSMVPPSVHPSGELVQADGDLLHPPHWTWLQIVRAAGLIAFLDVCVRLYPTLGTRHTFCMALPLHAVDAPVAGHGKTLLVDCAALVATGHVSPKVAQGWEEAEDEKRLGGSLLRGDSLVLIDNIERPVGGDFLCSVITESVVQVRPLGQTGQIDVPTNLLICATGNNIKVRGDMVRRTLKCRMDAGIERPEERKFDIDLRAYVTERRTELVVACLTILRGFVVTPDRGSTLAAMSPYGSFKEWSDRVRGALIWLGEADPCETRAAIRDDDPVTSTLAALIAAWVQCLGIGDVAAGTGWFTTGEVCNAAKRVDDRFGMPLHPALHEALGTLLLKAVTPEGLGSKLSKYVDRVVNGYRLRKRQHPETRTKQYLVEQVASQSSTAPVQKGFDFPAKAGTAA